MAVPRVPTGVRPHPPGTRVRAGDDAGRLLLHRARAGAADLRGGARPPVQPRRRPRRAGLRRDLLQGPHDVRPAAPLDQVGRAVLLLPAADRPRPDLAQAGRVQRSLAPRREPDRGGRGGRPRPGLVDRGLRARGLLTRSGAYRRPTLRRGTRSTGDAMLVRTTLRARTSRLRNAANSASSSSWSMRCQRAWAPEGPVGSELPARLSRTRRIVRSRSVVMPSSAATIERK